MALSLLQATKGRSEVGLGAQHNFIRALLWAHGVINHPGNVTRESAGPGVQKTAFGDSSPKR